MWNSPFEFPDLHLGCVAGSVIRPAPRLKAWGVKKTPVNIRFSGANNTVLFFVGAVELVLLNWCWRMVRGAAGLICFSFFFVLFKIWDITLRFYPDQ